MFFPAIELCRSAQLHQFTVTLNLLLTKKYPFTRFTSFFDSISREGGGAVPDERVIYMNFPYAFNWFIIHIYLENAVPIFWVGSRIFVWKQNHWKLFVWNHWKIFVWNHWRIFVQNQWKIFVWNNWKIFVWNHWKIFVWNHWKQAKPICFWQHLISPFSSLITPHLSIFSSMQFFISLLGGCFTFSPWITPFLSYLIYLVASLQFFISLLGGQLTFSPWITPHLLISSSLLCCNFPYLFWASISLH